MLKVFISYSNNDKHIAGELKKLFEEYEVIDCFIAHDDIKPGTEWEAEILRNLESSDFFMPLQTENLKNSYWCQQEAGFALAKGTKIVPLKPDAGGIDPIGFYEKFQAHPIKLGNLRESVKEWAKEEGIPGVEIREELETRLFLFERSSSWGEAGVNTTALLELKDNFKESDIHRIVEATLGNPEILNSFSARASLRPFFIKNARYIDGENLKILLG